MQSQFGYTDRDIEFGKTSDTPAIFFIAVIDIDKQILRIPCLKSLISISALVDSYLKITSHTHKFEGRPCFRVLNGKLTKEIAPEKQSLFQLGLNFKTICFRVEDSAHPQNDLTEVLSWLNNNSEILQNEEDHIELQLCLQGKKIKHIAGKKMTVLKLKERLVKSLPELKGVTAESIVLHLQGALLHDVEKRLQQVNLADKQIKIFVLKKQCCFKGNTQIMLHDQTYTDIQKVSPGDRIATFNRTTQQLEESIVGSTYETIITESIVIKFNNGIEIETTPNHLLWTEDEAFRLVKSKDPKEVSLAEGQNLKLYNGKLVEISSIQRKLIPPQPFYNVITQQNKNIIINYGVVSHHQYIKVKAPDGLIQCIDVTPSDTFGTVKQKLEKIYHLKSQHQKLMCFAKMVKDDETISDKNIANESLVYLSLLSCQKFNLVHPDTLLRIHDNEQNLIKASEINESQEISSIDIDSLALCKEAAKVDKVQAVKLSEYIAIHLGDRVLKICPQTYLLLNNKNTILALDFYRTYADRSARHWPQLQSIGQETFPIHKIQLIKEQASFIKVTSNAPNFVANGAVIPDTVVTIVMETKGNPEERFNLNLANSTTVNQIKQRLQKMTQIPLKEMNFVYDGQVIHDGDSLEDIKFSSQKVIIIRQTNKAHHTSIFLNESQIQTIQNKLINIHLSTGEKYALKYSVFKEWSIRDILRQCINIDDPAYFALFSEIIVFSHEPLHKMETSAAFAEPNNTILVLKNEKISFLNALAIESSEVHNSSCIVFQNQEVLTKIPEKSMIKVAQSEQLHASLERASSEIAGRVSQPSLRRQHFYKPFLYFTSRKYHSQISEYVRRFEQHRQEFNKEDSLFVVIKDLYYNMSLLPNHLGLCYYGVRNFRGSMLLRTGHTFYWHSFTLAYKDKEKVTQELGQHSGTLFKIQSTSAKVISPFAIDPNKNQVLFAPHSYFLVENVIEGKQMDEVWLTEVTAPFTFKKNIILWVDDNPRNNLRQYNTILNLKPNLQILQVTSTAAAEKWIKQFGWIILWKGLEFKLISDMGRWQIKGNQKVENFQAGIDLLELMYKTKGYSARTLIFCGNKKRGQENARKRNIPTERYIITEMQQELEKYVGISTE